MVCKKTQTFLFFVSSKIPAQDIQEPLTFFLSEVTKGRASVRKKTNKKKKNDVQGITD